MSWKSRAFCFIITLLLPAAWTAAQEEEFDPTVPATNQMTPAGILPEGISPADLLVSDNGETLYILEEGTSRLRIADLKNGDAPLFVSIPFIPARMAFFPDRKKIAVVGGGADGKAAVISLSGNGEIPLPAVEAVFNAGHTPSAAVVGLNESGEPLLYVANRFNGTIWELDAATGEKLREFEAGREPFDLVITPDFQHLVTCSLAAELRADVAFTLAKVRVVDLAGGEVFPIETHNGVSNLRGIALSPDGEYAFVTGTAGNYLTVTSQVVGGWIVENIVAVMDVRRHEMVDLFYLDETLRGAANPWGISVTADGKFLAVALAGTDDILLLPYERVLELIQKHPSGSRPGYGTYVYASEKEPGDRLPFRIRTATSLPGIRRLAVSGKSIWSVSYFGDSVVRIDPELTPPFQAPEKKTYGYPPVPKPLAEEPPVLSDEEPLHFTELDPYEPLGGVTIRRFTARLAPKPEPSPVRRGEELFHSALYCMEHWQSCATCHPDARVDGLNWDLLNDGVGNPKNTKSLLLSHETPPSMITGVRADAETAVRAGVVHILFSRLPEEDCRVIDAYLKSMRPLPSPHRVNGRLSESAERGRYLFESSRTGCSNCHPEPLFTDLSFHRGKEVYYNESRTQFDTPTLVEVWRTAPYMNNGHWLTVREMLTGGKHGNENGRIEALTEEELNDLIEYVLSL